MDTFSIPDSSILNRLQPAIDDALKSNSLLYKDSSGVISKFDLSVGPVNVLLIPNTLHRRLNGVLALHNHEKGFELTTEDLELINHMLHSLLLGLENLISHYESIKLRQGQTANGKKLTPRELEILKCMAAGHSDQEIAKMLYISFHTVRSHVSHLFKKLGVSSRSQAIIKGIREGLVDSSG
jgi:DNA-binding CsgD family transcriptional regulator